MRFESKNLPVHLSLPLPWDRDTELHVSRESPDTKTVLSVVKNGSITDLHLDETARLSLIRMLESASP